MNQTEHRGGLLHPLQVWGGIECTVNRVGEQYYDQLIWNGHDVRLEDLPRIAALGIKAIRYPVLWERIAPNGLEHANWQWTDKRLRLLRDLNVRPIVGLIHHGSGPRYTSLLDSHFLQKFADYARAVAERYPWLDAYCPINEPLTTARFSGLYGHWYPHRTDPVSLIQILLNEIRGTQQAMKAIREINPSAQLIQTDDIGKVYSAPALDYQARHENERRWLAFDLLCGRVDRYHPLFDYLTWLRISASELETIQRDAAPPDILGINYYVTSERYLDDRLALYPDWMHGGNGRDSYVDVEAVRVCREEPAGHTNILREAWDRYHHPLALTEVHLGGHREQQLRWWMDAWNSVQTLRQSGVDIRAITAWSLLGSFNWHNLVTRDDAFYESGVFDVRSPTPRATILARAIETSAKGNSFDHPALDTSGWWRNENRLLHVPVSRAQNAPRALEGSPPTRTPRPIIITGATGTLGHAFQRICEERNIPFVALSRQQLDIADAVQVKQMLQEVKPWAVVNAAGYVRVDDAERERDICLRANTVAPAMLAELCARYRIRLVSFSSDLVFNGKQSTPYVESQEPDPLNIYGHSKAEAETRIQATHSQALIIRTSAFFGPWDAANFLVQVGRALAAQQKFSAPDNVFVSPTYVPDLVHTSLDLLIDGEQGVWHLANQGAISWFDFANRYVRMAGLNNTYLQAIPLEEMSFAAARPRYSVLSSERGLLLPELDDAMFRFVQAIEPQLGGLPISFAREVPSKVE